MEYTTFGRTGLRVSVAGLGLGGPSRAGLRAGLTAGQSVALIRQAMDLGVNVFDTANAYHNETILGTAISSVPRDLLIVSTKFHARNPSAAQIVDALEASLRDLGTDYVDVFHLHSVLPDFYDHAVAVLVPALLKQRDLGKLRFIGITESTTADPGRVTLQRAVEDDCWDVVMIGHHMMNQGARGHILPRATERKLGTQIMAPARNLFVNQARLLETVKRLAAEGKISGSLGESDDPLGFLVHAAGADSITDAAYRYARHESGADMVLFGTSSAAHLKANVRSLLKPTLPRADVNRLAELFGHLDAADLRPPEQPWGLKGRLRSILHRVRRFPFTHRVRAQP